MQAIASVLMQLLMLLPQSPGQATGEPRRPPSEFTPWFTQWAEERDERRLPAPTTQQLSDLDDFGQEHSPVRWEDIQALPEPQRSRMIAIMAQRYRQLQRLKERDPEVYELRLGRLKLEDDVYRLRRDLDQYQDRQLILRRMELENTAHRLVRQYLTERQLRLRRLEELVAREKDRLNEDEARISDIARDMYVDPVARDPRFFLEEPMERPGPPPGGPRGPRQGFGGPRREGPGRMGPPPQRPAEGHDGEPAPPPPPDAEPRQE